MKRLLALPILLFLCAVANAQMPATCVPGTNVYYISSGIGSDSNTQTQAKSKTTPWAHAPKMLNFTGTYSHTAGDCFVFRGGDTWTASSFHMVVNVGGTSSAPDYYGVDLTWFAGGSFARPIFDMANTTPTGNSPIQARAQWIIFDNIELKRYLIVSGINECADANMDLGTSASGNITVENMYIHDWTITSLVSGSTSHGTGSICQNGETGPINVNNVTMSDAATTAPVPFGACFRNLNEIKNSDCEHTGEGEVGLFGPIHDNIFANINGNAVAALDPANHTNILEPSPTCETPTIYNNLIHDTTSGVTIYICSRGQIYNNVMWNNSNFDIKLSGIGQPASDVLSIYNNTVDCSNSTPCVGMDSKGVMAGTLNLKNNHWITNGSPTCFGVSGCSAITTLHQSNNLLLTTSQATTNGYTIATKYKAFPAPGPTSTVAFGVNLTAQATGSLAALALDAEGAFWNGASYVARPTGATAWDAGWAQSPGSGGGTPPTVTVTQPTAGTVGGTVTITVTASGGTISSVQPLVDGNTFGNACTASPCSVSWDTTKVGNGTHTVGGTATNATGQGTATVVTVTVSNTAPGCTISGATWTNTSFTAQTGSFSATLTVTPNGIPPVGSGGPVVGLSQSSATSYGSNSTLLRQSDNGFWEMYNPASPPYSHAASVSWIVGTPATFTWQVNVVANTVSLQVTQNSVTSTIGTSIGFRTPATSLGFWNLDPTSAPVTLTVCNFGLGATGALTPTSFNFGTLNVGLTASQNFTLTNNGGSPLSWTAFNVTPIVFTIPSNSCVSPLAPGASCPLTVQFAPASPTAYSGTLSLTTGGTVNSVALTGAGSSISVPSVPSGLTATAMGTTIALSWTASTGTAPITYNVNRATVSGGPYTSIATGLSSPSFSDTNLAAATYYYVVSATNSAGTSANSAQASATITPTLPQVNLNPANLAFGNTLVSGSLLETVANIGTANLVIGTPTIGGANQLDFSLAAGCTGVTVTPNSSCPILVTFTPSTTTTQEQATLCVPSNAASSPDCLVMTGQGVLPVTVSPATIAFGNIRPNATSAAQTITFTNQTGATVTFSSIAVTGGDSTQFTKGTDLCGGSVANNASCTVQVTFTPNAPGGKSSALVFTDSATGSPHSVTLTGQCNSRRIAKTL